ncbi:MAG: HopJ type III effector protein [Mucilaginibacter sp.]
MDQQLQRLLEELKENEVTFDQVIDFINTRYQHQPTAFKNGDTYNEESQNQGSARVFAFAQLNNLSKEDTLWLFAEHYRAVLVSPEGTDHQNIRQFMQYGWPGIAFNGQALLAR